MTNLYDKEGNQLTLEQVFSLLSLKSVNRVEVIDQKGRSYVNWKPGNIVETSLQDQGKTLKIFIE